METFVSIEIWVGQVSHEVRGTFAKCMDSGSSSEPIHASTPSCTTQSARSGVYWTKSSLWARDYPPESWWSNPARLLNQFSQPVIEVRWICRQIRFLWVSLWWLRNLNSQKSLLSGWGPPEGGVYGSRRHAFTWIASGAAWNDHHLPLLRSGAWWSACQLNYHFCSQSSDQHRNQPSKSIWWPLWLWVLSFSILPDAP